MVGFFYGWDGDLFVWIFVSYFEGMEKFFAVLYISNFQAYYCSSCLRPHIL
jgi:hypothetical protein